MIHFLKISTDSAERMWRRVRFDSMLKHGRTLNYQMMKQVKCKSGLTGWESRLRKVYDTYDQFRRLCEFYGLHTRLGYKTPKAAWRNNPIIQGSVNPSDYRRA